MKKHFKLIVWISVFAVAFILWFFVGGNMPSCTGDGNDYGDAQLFGSGLIDPGTSGCMLNPARVAVQLTAFVLFVIWLIAPLILSIVKICKHSNQKKIKK
jgi:hypothetical protein